ncbi:MAG: MFS transporter [Firmicutes bacterium]|nr:MFS transporter [Bacillota bacterium]
METGKKDLRTKLCYGAGYLPDPCFYQFIATFQIVFLTGVVGLTPAAAGTISSLTIMADAVFSLFVGKWSDNLRSRFGRRRPFLLAVSFVMPLAFAMMFRTAGGSDTAKFWYYMLWGFVFWIGYAVFFVCYVALGADVATDYEDRILLNSYTRLFTLGGAVLGTALPLTAIGALTARGMEDKNAWALFAALLAALVMACSLLCWRATRGCERPVFEEPESQGLKGFLTDCRQLLTLSPYRKIIASKIASGLAYAFFTGTLIFYMQYVLQIDTRFSSVIYLLSNILSLVLLPFIAGMSLKIGKRKYMAYAEFVTAVLSVLLALTGVRSRTLLILYVVVYIFGQASFWQICNTNLYDISDLDEYRFGVRREGNIMALQSFINTCFTSLDLKILSILLTVSGFSATAAVQSETALRMLKVMFLWLPAAGALMAGVFMLLYRVNKEDFILLKEALYRRHQGMEEMTEEETARIEGMFR